MRIKTKHIEAAREIRQWVVLFATAACIFISADGDQLVKSTFKKLKKGV